MDYFWKQQYDIPNEMGYPLFGPVHIAALSVTFLVIAVLLYALHHASVSLKDRVVTRVPVLLALLEILKDLELYWQGRMSIGYLPLHLCSLGIFVYLLFAFSRQIKTRAFFGEIAFCMILPGSIFGLLFADWTTLYPFLNFMNLYSYLWHGLLCFYPLFLVQNGFIHPSLDHYRWNLFFLCCIIPPIYLFDTSMHCNYLFILEPVPGSPLALLASFMGNPGYLAGYALIVCGVIFLTYLVYYGILSLKRK